MEQQNNNEGVSVEQFRYQTLLQQHLEQTAALTERIVALQVENQVLRQQLQKFSNVSDLAEAKQNSGDS